MDTKEKDKKPFSLKKAFGIERQSSGSGSTGLGMKRTKSSGGADSSKAAAAAVGGGGATGVVPTTISTTTSLNESEGGPGVAIQIEENTSKVVTNSNNVTITSASAGSTTGAGASVKVQTSPSTITTSVKPVLADSEVSGAVPEYGGAGTAQNITMTSSPPAYSSPGAGIDLELPPAVIQGEKDAFARPGSPFGMAPGETASPAKKKEGSGRPGLWTCVHSVGFTEDANARFRPTMEDAHIMLDGFRGMSAEGFFGIYDGHGGRNAVDLVNKYMHVFFEEELANNPGGPSIQNGIPRAFFNTYRRVDEVLSQQKCNYVGTTSVTTYIAVDASGQQCIYTANVGDARAVLCLNGKAQRLSYDHKASDIFELKRVSDSGGFVAAKRVNGVLSVSRALGDHAMKNVVICAPHVTMEMIPRDEVSFLVLACDGLWDVYSDDEVAKFIDDKFTSKDMDVQRISRKLVKSALERGSTDNISIMVIRLR
mmetsp:Transcript_6952/g.12528  ORF Transcript_6952/g.12528 Transcript_6952/m.12528 type:complete len:482 (+) Transcript_6952:206-1651(+)